MSNPETSWPEDADGDVFRRLQGRGFDFSLERGMDFTVDFSTWPPPAIALDKLRALPSTVQVYDQDGGSDPYVLVKVSNKLTYEFVVNMQKEITDRVSAYGGKCDSWGLLS